jgi:hypothetical protein
MQLLPALNVRLPAFSKTDLHHGRFSAARTSVPPVAEAKGIYTATLGNSGKTYHGRIVLE